MLQHIRGRGFSIDGLKVVIARERRRRDWTGIADKLLIDRGRRIEEQHFGDNLAVPGALQTLLDMIGGRAFGKNEFLRVVTEIQLNPRSLNRKIERRRNRGDEIRLGLPLGVEIHIVVEGLADRDGRDQAHRKVAAPRTQSARRGAGPGRSRVRRTHTCRRTAQAGWPKVDGESGPTA